MAGEDGGAEVEVEVGEVLEGFDGEALDIEPLPADRAAAKAPAAPQAPTEETVSAADRAFVESKRQPGESWEDAALRLYNNKSHAYRRVEAEKRANRQALERLEAQQAQQRAELEPFLREYYRARQMEAQREQMAAIPDKEADPQGYAIWLAEETLRRQTQAEREAAAAAAEEQRLAAVADADEIWAGELQQNLAIPEFEADFQLVAQFGRQSLQHEFPSATAAQIQELLEGANVLAMRNALSTGRTIQEYIWGRAQMLRAFAGAAQRSPQSPAPAQPVGSPTAKRIASAAARAKNAGAMAGPGGPGGAGGLPGQEGSILDLPEDDFIAAALGNNKVDVTALSKRRFGVEG